MGRISLRVAAWALRQLGLLVAGAPLRVPDGRSQRLLLHSDAGNGRPPGPHQGRLPCRPPKDAPTLRWVHVTAFMGAHIGAFRAVRMSEGGEWQDPRVVPNVIFYRLNRALVRPRKSLSQRVTGLTYFDGVIRNRFGMSTQELMQAMRTWHRIAVESEPPPLCRPAR